MRDAPLIDRHASSGSGFGTSPALRFGAAVLLVVCSLLIFTVVKTGVLVSNTDRVSPAPTIKPKPARPHFTPLPHSEADGLRYLLTERDAEAEALSNTPPPPQLKAQQPQHQVKGVKGTVIGRAVGRAMFHGAGDGQAIKRRVHLCHLASGQQRGIVAGGSRYSTDWMHALDAMVFLYQFSDPTAPHFYPQGGNEAGAYLQFIVDYYECLPTTIAFVHGHQHSWHSLDMLENLRALRWDLVTQHRDLNRIMPIWTHKVGILSATPEADVVAELPDSYNGSYNVNQIYKGKVYDFWNMFVWLQQVEGLRAYDRLFGPMGVGPLPDTADFICCAQFVVDRDTIRRRPQAFWQAALDFVRLNDLQASHNANKPGVVGDIFVTFWAMIFGKPPKSEDWGGIPECDLFDCG